jgi:CMP-N,N'-diacetyllegionaminic acid synthase
LIGNKKVLALIPARGGSKGLPGKNSKSLGGKPLLGWPIQAARESRHVDRVIVSTDDPGIAEKARELGGEIPFLRPSPLASDTATTFSVIEHAIKFLEERERTTFDYIVLLEPTSPLTEAEDVDKAIEILESKRVIADSIVSVSRLVNAHPDFTVSITNIGVIAPYGLNGFASMNRRQDLSRLYVFEGTIYISDTQVLLTKRSFYHDRTLPYVVPKWKSFEIDDFVDFLCVETIMNNREVLKRTSPE